MIEPVSPELALVDPELAARLRAALPLPGDCLAPVERVVQHVEFRREPAHRHPSLLVAVCAVLLAALVGTPGGPSNSSSGAPAQPYGHATAASAGAKTAGSTATTASPLLGFVGPASG